LDGVGGGGGVGVGPGVRVHTIREGVVLLTRTRHVSAHQQVAQASERRRGVVIMPKSQKEHVVSKGSETVIETV